MTDRFALIIGGLTAAGAMGIGVAITVASSGDDDSSGLVGVGIIVIGLGFAGWLAWVAWSDRRSNAPVQAKSSPRATGVGTSHPSGAAIAASEYLVGVRPRDRVIDAIWSAIGSGVLALVAIVAVGSAPRVEDAFGLFVLFLVLAAGATVLGLYSTFQWSAAIISRGVLDALLIRDQRRDAELDR